VFPDVTKGTKQSCALAPLLFIIFFAMMLRDAFRDCSFIAIHYCTEGNVLDLQRLQDTGKNKKYS